MAHPTCDNECTRMGWIEALVDNGATELHISHAPGVDLDDRFAAFCHDEQEMLWINGWQMASYQTIEAIEYEATAGSRREFPSAD